MANVNVNLDIMAWPLSNPVPVGYNRARDGGGNNIAYCYAFTGGNSAANDGTVQVTRHKDAKTIKIKRAQSSSLQFDVLFALFKDPPMAGITVDAQGKNNLKIVNPATELGTCNYSVIATLGQGNPIYIYCDPRIENAWEHVYPEKKKKKKKKATKKKVAGKKPAKKKTASKKPAKKQPASKKAAKKKTTGKKPVKKSANKSSRKK